MELFGVIGVTEGHRQSHYLIEGLEFLFD